MRMKSYKGGIPFNFANVGDEQVVFAFCRRDDDSSSTEVKIPGSIIALLALSRLKLEIT